MEAVMMAMMMIVVIVMMTVMRMVMMTTTIETYTIVRHIMTNTSYIEVVLVDVVLFIGHG
jgi:hypothetical protein